jgi:adenine-specific DNA-methyltransferase
VRVGDKVRRLAPRGEALHHPNLPAYQVVSINGSGINRLATLITLDDSRSEENIPVDDLVVIAEFRDSIYPGLVSTGKVERGGSKPFHAVISAENFHAIQALLYCHRGQVDAIYIDPPYNTGAKDWKYDNDYVEADDIYRHSKWLAMLERRLLLAKELLNPDESALIVTIDEKEYLRLGLLLEQVFPESDIQMVTSVINPSGSSRQGRFGRADEYIFYVYIGSASITPWKTDMLRDVSQSDSQKVRWNGLIRNGEGSRRSRIPTMFYPIFIDRESGALHSVGEPLAPSAEVSSVVCPPGTIAILPIDGMGQEMMWRLHPPTLREYLEKGYAKLGRRDPATGQRSPQYLQRGTVAKLESGAIKVLGRDAEGGLILEYHEGAKTYSPLSVWNRVSHSAAEHGSAMLKALIPGRKFPYPKSLYAVEDCLRFVVADKPDALIVDFFGGSGTTAHAVARLNHQDNGRRRSIVVSNNEVSAEEQATLRGEGLRPGDLDWEKWGICDYITKPRIQSAFTGLTPEGVPIKGSYKFTDEFPVSDGLNENVEFFSLTYEAPMRVQSNREFSRIAPFLWLKSGAQGRRIDTLQFGWDVADTYAVISDLDLADEFLKALRASRNVASAFIVTDDDRLFQSLSRDIPAGVEPVRLYDSYLRNFEIDAMRSVR